ncbi:MAG: S1 RNA-binding domain-containing protein [Planctomycetota bacterium]|nr:S1 RNA-binding domain-containing protein [Planctomycetota bacterium]
MPDEETNPPIDMDAKLEAEIEAALGDLSVEDMLDYADRSRAAPGGVEREYKTGVIAAVHGNDVLVEFGPKAQGVCPLEQFAEPPTVGERTQFIIERFDENEGLLILSREGVVRRAEWESLDVGQHVEARCTGTNKGGLEMEIAHHQAFMPAGHVDLRHIEDLSVFVGEKMPCEIIELDRQRGRIILSRRAHLETERRRLREELLETLEVGQTMPAVITSLQHYGAFADLGGIDGLIHISDLSYQRINHPSEAVKEGDQVNVKILKIDREQDPPRIGLGLKQTLEDPYAAEVSRLEVGATVSGRVTKLMAFGAFVELAPGVEGLIHISELSPERVQKVSSVVKPGEVVTVKVLSVDADQRRIGLSLKAARAEEEGRTFDRHEDPHMRKLKEQMRRKFGGDLKGGLG